MKLNSMSSLVVRFICNSHCLCSWLNSSKAVCWKPFVYFVYVIWLVDRRDHVENCCVCHLHSDFLLFCLIRFFPLKLYSPLLDSFLQGLNNCWQHRKVKTFIKVNHLVIFCTSNLIAPGHIPLAQPSINGAHVVQSMKAKRSNCCCSINAIRHQTKIILFAIHLWFNTNFCLFGKWKFLLVFLQVLTYHFCLKHKFERHNVMASIAPLALFPLRSVLESAHFMSCSRAVTSQNIIHCLKKQNPHGEVNIKKIPQYYYDDIEVISNYRIPYFEGIYQYWDVLCTCRVCYLFRRWSFALNSGRTVKWASHRLGCPLPIVKRVSDVMTQTRLRQTNWNGWWFWRFLSEQKPVFLKHLWNKNFAYIPCISLRTRLCSLSLTGSSVICILFLDFAHFAIKLRMDYWRCLVCTLFTLDPEWQPVKFTG